MTREDIKKANEIIQNVEKLEKIKENINKSHAITFHVSPMIGDNINISDNIEKKELIRSNNLFLTIL